MPFESEIKPLVSDIDLHSQMLEDLLKKEIDNDSLYIYSKPAFDEFVKSIRPEQEYDEYLKDKRVAIVGPSRYLLTGEHNSLTGGHIDSHDVVVRIKCEGFLPFNENKNISKRIQQIGSKVNVIYSWRGLGKLEDWTEKFNRCDVRFFRNPNAAEIRATHPGSRHVIRKIDSFVETQFNQYGFAKYINKTAHSDRNLDFYKIELKENLYFSDPAPYKWMWGRVRPPGSKPDLQTGSAGIMELLTTDFKEIYITGVTFYHSGLNMFQLKDAKHANAISGTHDGTLEMRLFMDFLINEIQTRGSLKRIKVDRVLYKIVKLYVGVYKSAHEQKTFWAGQQIADEVTAKIKQKFGNVQQ